MTHSQEGKKNQSMEAEREMTEMAELADKNVKTVNVNMLCTLKKVEETWIRKETEDIERSQIELSEIKKYIVSEMKNILNGIY